jgi:hypothetical protein
MTLSGVEFVLDMLDGDITGGETFPAYWKIDH